MVEYHPISAKDQWRLHAVRKFYLEYSSNMHSRVQFGKERFWSQTLRSWKTLDAAENPRRLNAKRGKNVKKLLTFQIPRRWDSKIVSARSEDSVILDFWALMNVTLGGDDGEDVIPNGAKFSLRPTRTFWKTYVRTEAAIFRKLRTIFARYNQDTVQKIEPESCTRLKNVVQKYLNQKDRTASGAPVRRKGNERSRRENRKQGDCNLRLVEGHCSKGDSCSSKHELGSKGNAKGKHDRPRSLSAGSRAPRCDSKDGEKECVIRKSPERHQSVWKREAASVLQLLEKAVHEGVLSLLAPSRHVSTLRMTPTAARLLRWGMHRRWLCEQNTSHVTSSRVCAHL